MRNFETVVLKFHLERINLLQVFLLRKSRLCIESPPPLHDSSITMHFEKNMHFEKTILSALIWLILIHFEKKIVQGLVEVV